MAMTGDAMAALVQSKIEALTNYPDQTESPVFSDVRILKAFCEGIVEYIQAHSEVPPGSFTNGGGSVTGVGGPVQ